jgi:hypothetical protein
MHKIFVIVLRFLLVALHVSDYTSPSSVSNFISCTSHIPVYVDTSGCCVAIATQQPDVWYRHIPNYFLLDALYVADCRRAGANFINCTLHLVYSDTSGFYLVIGSLPIATQEPDVLYRHITNAMYSL